MEETGADAGKNVVISHSRKRGYLTGVRFV